MIQTIRIFSQDIGMEFGIEKLVGKEKQRNKLNCQFRREGIAGSEGKLQILRNIGSKYS